MIQLAVGEMTVDKAFYTALKLHVYNTVHDGLLATLMKGRSVVINETVKLNIGRFTARKTNNLFVPASSAKTPTSSAEFYGFTSHKVREKLSDFEEAGILELTGKGLRDAFTYRWILPVKHWEVCSFMRFRRTTEDDLTMNFELSRAFHAFGQEPFKFPEFFSIYQAAHEEEYASTRWGKRKWDKLRKSYDYQNFVKARLEKLADHGLVVKGDDQYAVAKEAADTVHHFDLFIDGAAFHPSVKMCRACPLDAMCRGGSTQNVVRALNNTANGRSQGGQ